MLKLINPDTDHDISNPLDEVTSLLEDKLNLELSSPLTLVDYSNLFGDEFRMQDEQWDCSYLNVLDMAVVEEAILHVLYSCASQFTACSLQQVGREILGLLGCTTTYTSSAARLSVSNALCLVLVADSRHNEAITILNFGMEILP
ncbi:hypothetical protein V8G54_009170 [Vigna mungo]|uniref:Uncharacterized protein n=1 Tax=Vigna mungo TaxID=3915 RepID=A0AAQ3S4L1_VIGMU